MKKDPCLLAMRRNGLASGADADKWWLVIQPKVDGIGTGGSASFLCPSYIRSLAKPGVQEVDEGADLRRQIAPVRIDRVDAAIMRQELVEYGHEAAVLQLLPGNEIGHAGDPKAGLGGAKTGQGAVDLHRPADRNRK